MAKVKGALLSIEASGAFGKSLIFTKGKQGQNVTVWHKPNNEISGTQQINRTKYRAGLDAWLALTLGAKMNWNNQAKLFKMTGMNYFMRGYMKDIVLPVAILWDNGEAVWDLGEAVWYS